MPVPELQKDIDRFYALLSTRCSKVDGTRQLKDCDGRKKWKWPKGGVYFFFEEGEYRQDQPGILRVVRVGTHALTEISKTTLWNRLKQHKGTDNGGGNHRGSVFRLHVGTALIEKQRCHAAYPYWGKGTSAKKEITDSERPMELQVSKYIGQMPFLWLAVDTPGMRAHIEKHAIGLLCNRGKPVDTQSPTWLGKYSSRPAIRQSGLWNVKHTEENYDPSFLDDLEDLLE
jgi:hypothetical protein